MPTNNHAQSSAASATKKKPRAKRRKWDEESIERELRDAIAEHGEWPTYSDLVGSGRGALARTIGRRGGLTTWARKLGFQPGLKPGERYWTEERVRLTLREFLKDRRVRFPTEREFREAGLLGLYRVLGERKELGRWARRFRLEKPRPGRPKKWTDEAIRSTLAEFLSGRETWPTCKEFEEAGLGGLLGALYLRRDVSRWAEEFGVVRLSAKERRKERNDNRRHGGKV